MGIANRVYGQILVLSFLLKCGGGVGNQCGASSFPDGEITGLVAYVIKVSFTELFDQDLGFFMAFEVNIPIGGQYFIKKPEVLGNGFGDSYVAGRHKKNLSAFVLFFFYKINDGLIPWQVWNLWSELLCKFGFQCRATLCKPLGDFEQCCRVLMNGAE